MSLTSGSLSGGSRGRGFKTAPDLNRAEGPSQWLVSFVLPSQGFKGSALRASQGFMDLYILCST